MLFCAVEDCFSKTLAESGFFSLYRGLSAPLLGSMAECASLFVSYGYVKKFLGVDEEAPSFSSSRERSLGPNAGPRTTDLGSWTLGTLIASLGF